MARTTKIVNFSLPPEIYKQMEELAKQRQTSKSQILREALKQLKCFRPYGTEKEINLL